MKFIKLIPSLLLMIIGIPIGVFLGLKYEFLFLAGYIYSPIEDFIKLIIDEYLWSKQRKRQM
jgi:hypothetical protein